MLFLKQIQEVGGGADAEKPLDGVEYDVNSALRCHGDHAILHVISALSALSAAYRRLRDGNPSESSVRSSSRQPSLTFTCRSRNTLASKKASSSFRAAVPMALIRAPPLPTRIGFCDSRSTRIVQYSRIKPLASGSSNLSTTTAVESGSSSRV